MCVGESSVGVFNNSWKVRRRRRHCWWGSPSFFPSLSLSSFTFLFFGYPFPTIRRRGISLGFYQKAPVDLGLLAGEQVTLGRSYPIFLNTNILPTVVIIRIVRLERFPFFLNKNSVCQTTAGQNLGRQKSNIGRRRRFCCLKVVWWSPTDKILD